MVDLDEISNAFAEYMDVNDDDIAVVPYDSLGDLLDTIGIAPSLAQPLAQEMDPAGTGFIEFEPFVNTVVNHLAENEEHQGDEDCQETYLLLEDADTGVITEASMLDMAAKLRLTLNKEDIHKMIRLAKSDPHGSRSSEHDGITRAEFARLWDRLNNVFGAEVGP